MSHYTLLYICTFSQSLNAHAFSTFRNNTFKLHSFILCRRGRSKFTELVPDPTVYTTLTINYVQTQTQKFYVEDHETYFQKS